MSTHRISAWRRINAPAERVYGIVADYLDGHQRILPRPPFVGMDVIAGGKGAGTVIRAGIKAFGRVQEFTARVEEPEPGRRLVESTNTGVVTTFEVRPVEGSTAVEAGIITDLAPRKGLAGMVERVLSERLLVPAYRRELDLLAAEAERGGG